jgi:tRNA pseudouridine38-40 synthase
LAQIYQKHIKVIGASRTDAGVSALSQIANFHIEANKSINLEHIKSSLNSICEQDILIKKIKAAPEDFHARFYSIAKIYNYKIINHRAPLQQRFAWVLPYEIKINKMRSSIKLFLKQKDYSAFCSVKDKDGKVIMKSITIRKKKYNIEVKIEANRFLYKMVRRIVGALVEVGRGHRTEDDVKRALIGEKHRPLICAPANGLILMKVKY